MHAISAGCCLSQRIRGNRVLHRFSEKTPVMGWNTSNDMWDWIQSCSHTFWVWDFLKNSLFTSVPSESRQAPGWWIQGKRETDDTQHLTKVHNRNTYTSRITFYQRLSGTLFWITLSHMLYWKHGTHTREMLLKVQRKCSQNHLKSEERENMLMSEFVQMFKYSASENESIFII